MSHLTNNESFYACFIEDKLRLDCKAVSWLLFTNVLELWGFFNGGFFFFLKTVVMTFIHQCTSSSAHMADINEYLEYYLTGNLIVFSIKINKYEPQSNCTFPALFASRKQCCKKLTHSV